MLPVLTLLAEEHAGSELFMPAPWFGIVVFAILMLSLLVTLGFSNKNRELPADPQAHH